MATADFATSPTERHIPIDVLRGFALLGILVMNIQSFSMIGMAYMNPYAYGDMSGANYWVWYLSHVIADQKFMTIFSMLFGAGIVLMAGRQEAGGVRPGRRHYRRMFFLLLIGLVHAHLIWYGDILVCYAMCGMAVYPLWRRRPVTLLVAGILMIAVHSAINAGSHWSMPHWPADSVEEFRRQMSAPPEEKLKEIEAYRGGWLQQMPQRTLAALMFETFMFATWSFWRAGGLMLVGMALYKLGVLTGQRTAKFYRALFVGGLLVGLPIIILGVRQIAAHDWDGVYLMFVGSEFNYWGSLFVSLAYVGLVMLACRAPALAGLTGRLAAVGQMALTNYLMQSLICTTLFYGHGFGLFGKVERVGQLGIVLAIWALQLLVSPWWLKHFRYGPAEWFWRGLTYGRWPGMRRV